jgi:predicted alpha/beta superfamily hydrolase
MVEFVVRVPEITPPWQQIFLAGDGTQLGNWLASGVALERQEDGSHRTRLQFPSGFRGRFLVTMGRWRDVEGDGRGREQATRTLYANVSVPFELDVRGWGRSGIRYHHDFASRFLPHPRTLSVWLPPGYDLESTRRFPVLYLHDGQNLFDPETAFAGNPWYADEVVEREVRASRVEPLILVGIANSVDRLREYGPRLDGHDRSGDWSREYGRFVVEEVKPFIDSSYRTLPDGGNTGIGGSSMGGLISLQLCKWYPDVFRKCAAMSPSLWWDQESFLLESSIDTQWMDVCRVWLDMGTREGATEAGMRAMVRRVSRLAQQFAGHGMREGKQFAFLEAKEGMHNEASWGARFDLVLQFLYGNSRND